MVKIVHAQTLLSEEKMMVLNSTLLGHTVPEHSHPHEQIEVVYQGRFY